MEAIRRIVPIPANRRIVVDLPRVVSTRKTAEVIVIVHEPSKDRRRKLRQMAKAAHDRAFQSDAREISRDFQAVDSEGW